MFSYAACLCSSLAGRVYLPYLIFPYLDHAGNHFYTPVPLQMGTLYAFSAVELKYAFPSMSLEKIAVMTAITPSHSVNITLILHTVFCLILLTFAF